MDNTYPELINQIANKNGLIWATCLKGLHFSSSSQIKIINIKMVDGANIWKWN